MDSKGSIEEFVSSKTEAEENTCDREIEGQLNDVHLQLIDEVETKSMKIEGDTIEESGLYGWCCDANNLQSHSMELMDATVNEAAKELIPPNVLDVDTEDTQQVVNSSEGLSTPNTEVDDLVDAMNVLYVNDEQLFMDPLQSTSYMGVASTRSRAANYNQHSTEEDARMYDIRREMKLNLLNVYIKNGDVKMLDELVDAVKECECFSEFSIYEEIAYAYARMDDCVRIERLLTKMKGARHIVTMKCYCKIIEGFLSWKNPSKAVFYMKRMNDLSFPVFCDQIYATISMAAEQSLLPTIMKCIYPALPDYDETNHKHVTDDGWTVSDLCTVDADELKMCVQMSYNILEMILVYCEANKNLPLMLQTESLARRMDVRYTMSSYESCIKLYVEHRDGRSVELLDELIHHYGCTEEKWLSYIELAAKLKFTYFVEKIVNIIPPVLVVQQRVFIAILKFYLDIGDYERYCSVYRCLKNAQEAWKLNTNASDNSILEQTHPYSMLSHYRLSKSFDRLYNLFAGWQSLGVARWNKEEHSIVEAAARKSTPGGTHVSSNYIKNDSVADANLYANILKMYVEMEAFDDCFALLDEMIALDLPVNCSLYNFIISKCISISAYDKVWRCIDHMKAAKIKADYEMSNLLMTMARGCQSSRGIERILDMLDDVDICKDEGLFCSVLDMYVRTKNTHRLVLALERFKKSDMKPELQTYGMLIKALGIFGRIEDCQSLWEELTKERNMDPSEITYGCMFDALVNNNCVSEAVDLFHEMKKAKRTRPNTIMYSTIIKGFAQVKQLDKALAIYEEMKRDCIPLNTVTYNSIVDACARVGAINKAAELLEDMLTDGVEPDLITFSTIIKGYCVHGQMNKSLQLLDAMKLRRIYPDGILYNLLLDGCVRTRQSDLCERLWNEMRLNGIPPSNFTLTILIKMYGRMGFLEKAFKLVEELPANYKFDINAHVYTCLMSACITNRKYRMAYEVFECMKRDGIHPDAKTYQTMIYGCVKGGQLQKAASLVEQAFGIDGLDSEFVKPSKDAIGYSLEMRTYKFLMQQLHQSGNKQLSRALLEKLNRCGISIPHPSTGANIKSWSTMDASNGLSSLQTVTPHRPPYTVNESPNISYNRMKQPTSHRPPHNTRSPKCITRLNGMTSIQPPHLYNTGETASLETAVGLNTYPIGGSLSAMTPHYSVDTSVSEALCWSSFEGKKLNSRYIPYGMHSCKSMHALQSDQKGTLDMNHLYLIEGRTIDKSPHLHGFAKRMRELGI